MSNFVPRSGQKNNSGFGGLFQHYSGRTLDASRVLLGTTRDYSGLGTYVPSIAQSRVVFASRDCGWPSALSEGQSRVVLSSPIGDQLGIQDLRLPTTPQKLVRP